LFSHHFSEDFFMKLIALAVLAAGVAHSPLWAQSPAAEHANAIVVPVPLSKKRRFERGHNQADVIGEVISEYAAVPLAAHALRRTDHSLMHRVGMDKKAREATVKNSFEVAMPRLVDGKDVLLVDDVFTSGSTASYCAKVLKKNGATGVKVITLARAVMYR
jgi:ComF family protein